MQVIPMPVQSRQFITLTIAGGDQLDIPASTVLFVETLTREVGEANDGARTGLFFDLGDGPQAALVMEPFPKVDKLVTRPDWLRLTGVPGKLLILASNVLGLRGMKEHPGGARCRVTHRVGNRVLPVDVMESRDDIRPMLETQE